MRNGQSNSFLIDKTLLDSILDDCLMVNHELLDE